MRENSLIASHPRILRHRELGSEASYRVLHQAGSLVQVEVLCAPGLAPGTRVYLTRAAVAHMDREPLASGRRTLDCARLTARAA